MIFHRAFLMSKILNKSFFEKPTLEVAEKLLGKVLVRKYHGKLLKGIITEVEAYVGPKDRASHASGGKTPRTEVMFREASRIYVYLIYGMYYCLNIVTEAVDYPAAVLVRGLKTNGLDLNGPGKVCRHFHIDKSLNAKTLGRKSGLWVELAARISKSKIKQGRRIGVDYAGSWAKKPWRFFIQQE